MRPVGFGEAVPAGTRLTLFSDDNSDRLFTVITFCIDKVSGAALDLETGVPCYQVEDEEGRIHLLLHLPIEEWSELSGVASLKRRRPRAIRPSFLGPGLPLVLIPGQPLDAPPPLDGFCPPALS
jgi:hypothetical protein